MLPTQIAECLIFPLINDDRLTRSGPRWTLTDGNSADGRKPRNEKDGRRCTTHAVRSLADASRLDDADRAALLAAEGCQPHRSAPSENPEHRGHSSRSGVRRPFTPASSSRLLTVTSL